jgi:hypothetical protein
MSKKPLDVEKWARRDTWFLEEGVMLLLGLDPFDVYYLIWPKPNAKGFDDIYETARSSAAADTLKARQVRWPSPRTLAKDQVPRWQYRWKVSPRDFLEWAREKEYPIPQGLDAGDRKAVLRLLRRRLRPRLLPWDQAVESISHLASCAQSCKGNFLTVPNGNPMSDPIAIIPKNNIDEIRVMWSEYKGRRYLDIRVYTEIESKADKVPTKKGVTLRPDLIPDLIKALQSAQS